jgi:uncharacterized protein
MPDVPCERRREVQTFLHHARDWAFSRPDVVGAAVVGSWARDTARADSDVDLVLLTHDPVTYTEHHEWLAALAPGGRLIRTRSWGVLVERRILLRSGLEIEMGVVRPSWAKTQPVDAGTKRAVRSGFRPILDPHGVLAALAAACRGA